jgi:flagellin
MTIRIHDNSNMFRLLNVFNQLEMQRATAFTRLSTGMRINSASDDPAGLIAMNSLESELSSVETAIDNNQRTKSMLDVADGALTEVSSLLSDIESLAAESAGDSLSAAEKAANQAQIDSALESIDRILNTSSFNGEKIFGGANQITASLTAADAADLKDVRVYSRNPDQTDVSLTVNVTAAATQATTSGTSIANITDNLSAETTMTVGGKDGTATVTIASGSSLDQMISSINQSKGTTGVSASKSGTELVMTSVDYGSDAFVTVNALSGDNDVVGTAQTGKIEGEDATVTVNGQDAQTDGTEIYYSGNGISLSANLADNTTGSRSITVKDGGATYQLGADSSTRATISLNGMNTASLGRSDLGYLSDLKSGGSADLASDPAQAVSIVKKAIGQVASEGARIGGFQRYQVNSTINSLGVQRVSLSSALSVIRDADMAAETAELERSNILSSAATSLLSMVNSDQKNMLSLLMS